MRCGRSKAAVCSIGKALFFYNIILHIILQPAEMYLKQKSLTCGSFDSFIIRLQCQKVYPYLCLHDGGRVKRITIHVIFWQKYLGITGNIFIATDSFFRYILGCLCKIHVKAQQKGDTDRWNLQGSTAMNGSIRLR